MQTRLFTTFLFLFITYTTVAQEPITRTVTDENAVPL